MDNNLKDLIDQAFEDGIGYESDHRQVLNNVYNENSSLLTVHQVREESDRNPFSNFIFSNCFPRYRNFNSTTFNK